MPPLEPVSPLEPISPVGETRIFKYKFGKMPKVVSSKTLRIADVLKALPPIPKAWISDCAIGMLIDDRMFGNDEWGNCVIAERAHHTLRLEYSEQKKLINISDNDVLNEYWKEGGATPSNPHPDNGLDMLSSLKSWRIGWRLDDKIYNIYAFGEINPLNHKEAMACAYLLNGADMGIMVPFSAIKQFEEMKTWDVVNPDGGLVSGHCIHICGFNPQGMICVTWGRKVQMTWNFIDRYCDELYGVVDNKDIWLPHSAVDVRKLNEYLKEVCK